MTEEGEGKTKTVLTAHERLYDFHVKRMEKQPNRVFKKYKRPNDKKNSDNLTAKPQQEFCITIPLKGAKGGVSYCFSN